MVSLWFLGDFIWSLGQLDWYMTRFFVMQEMAGYCSIDVGEAGIFRHCIYDDISICVLRIFNPGWDF